MMLKQKPWICTAALAAGAVLIFFMEWLGGLLMVTGEMSPGSNAPLVEPG